MAERSIEAPDHSRALVDVDATRRVYTSLDTYECSCDSCVNFLAAISSERLPPGVCDVLATIGIDLKNPGEPVRFDDRSQTNEGLYRAEYLFVGDADRSRADSIPIVGGTWHFARTPRNYTQTFGERYAALIIWVWLPWVLEERPASKP